MNKNTLLAFLGGVIAGGALALLLAPKSGEETREFLSEKIKDGIKSGLGEEKYNNLSDKIDELKSAVSEKMKIGKA